MEDALRLAARLEGGGPHVQRDGVRLAEVGRGSDKPVLDDSGLLM